MTHYSFAKGWWGMWNSKFKFINFPTAVCAQSKGEHFYVVDKYFLQTSTVLLNARVEAQSIYHFYSKDVEYPYLGKLLSNFVTYFKWNKIGSLESVTWIPFATTWANFLILSMAEEFLSISRNRFTNLSRLECTSLRTLCSEKVLGFGIRGQRQSPILPFLSGWASLSGLTSLVLCLQ